jgi:predicted fused transcriptional regulator/phosphomethylpyrimidine kinase/predicted transcriptional regulator
MKFVEEVVVESFLPTYRSMLAAALRDRGLTQQEVAAALGLSQSAVSKYAQGGVARTEAVETDDRVRDLVERVADGLASGEMTRVQALAETEVLIRRLADGDLLARLHEESMPDLAEAGGLDLHDPEGTVLTAERVRSSVDRALRALTAASGVAALVPAVGSNVVECLPDARGVEDVAGVPGRIVDVKGRPTVPADPEFGVSGHVAGVLLAARAAGADARAAVNVRYDPAFVERLTDAGLVAVAFDPAADRGDVADAVERALADRAVGDRFALYQTGAVGVEPILYVLGPDAPTAVRTVRDHLV